MSMQCAAVSTCLTEIKLPPHWKEISFSTLDWYCNKAIHGYEPIGTFVPSLIRGLAARPHFSWLIKPMLRWRFKQSSTQGFDVLSEARGGGTTSTGFVILQQKSYWKCYKCLLFFWETEYRFTVPGLMPQMRSFSYSRFKKYLYSIPHVCKCLHSSSFVHSAATNELSWNGIYIITQSLSVTLSDLIYGANQSKMEKYFDLFHHSAARKTKPFWIFATNKTGESRAV